VVLPVPCCKRTSRVGARPCAKHPRCTSCAISTVSAPGTCLYKHRHRAALPCCWVQLSGGGTGCRVTKRRRRIAGSRRLRACLWRYSRKGHTFGAVRVPLYLHQRQPGRFWPLVSQQRVATYCLGENKFSRMSQLDRRKRIPVTLMNNTIGR